MPNRLTTLLVILLAAMLPRVALAHHDPLSSLTITVEPQAVRMVLVTPADELALWQPATAAQTPEQYAAAAARRLRQEAADLFELRLNYNVVSPSSARASAEAQVIRLELEYPAPEGEPVRSLQVFSNLVTKLTPGHRQVTCVQDARAAGTVRVVSWVTLTKDQFTAFVELPESATTRPANVTTATSQPAGVSFFQLGVEHILTGWDHLLFLAALLLVCATFREAATVITCFTVAHSITLALAALDVVRLPSRVVESIIAASIVYVAMENALTSGDQRHRLAWRAAITFAFGLVHGLGFASVLRELGLGSTPGGVVVPLLKFNLGVETGQLAVTAVIFPLILVVRRAGRVTEKNFVPACSALIAAVGAYWLIMRVAVT